MASFQLACQDPYAFYEGYDPDNDDYAPGQCWWDTLSRCVGSVHELRLFGQQA